MFTPAEKVNIIAQMDSTHNKWTDSDPAASNEFLARIDNAGRNLQLITYSDLVKNIKINLPNLKADYQICVWDWKDLDRSMIGSFLGRISLRTFADYNFMASALVVLKDANGQLKPSTNFFEWMLEVGAISDLNEMTILVFWADQVSRAHNFFRHGTVGL